MKKMFTVFALVVSLAILLSSCAPAEQIVVPSAKGGVLNLKVNPEIAISYDENGNVTEVKAINADAVKILENYGGFEGKACGIVVSELVNAIGEAGYFVDDIDGELRKVILEIEPGSVVPNENFLDNMTSEIQKIVESKTEKTAAEKDVPVVSEGSFEPAVSSEPAAPAVPENSDKNDNAAKKSCDNPYCDDWDCDDFYCGDGPREETRTCDNPYCDDWDCDDFYCDDGHREEARTCDNPYCDDWDCDDFYCDDGPYDD